MEIFNMHEAKSRLSQLVDKAAKGESVVIAKAGKPVARVVAIDSTNDKKPRRTGFLTGRIQVPDDFDRIGDTEIAQLFGLTTFSQPHSEEPNSGEPPSGQPPSGEPR